jgi:cardiolipin synthase A/B
VTRTLLHLLASHLSTVLGFFLATLLLSRVLRERRSPSSTFAWLLAIGLVPWVGVPLYLVFGGRKLQRMAAKKVPLYVPAFAVPRPVSPTNTQRILASSGAPPPVSGNRVELLSTGEAAFSSLLELVRGATSSIEVAMFILAGDDAGDPFVDALTERARAGVTVRLMLDALFAFRADKKRLAELQRAGGKVAWFGPVLHLPFRGHTNLRNHRKIVIADGRRAVVGGMNVAREYMGPHAFAGRWRDLSLRIEGPAVADIAAIFAGDWQFASGEALDPARSAPAPASDSLAGGDGGSGGEAQVVASGPDVASDIIYDALISAVFEARQRIFIATPYFVPDEALARALVLASRRGVDVRVVVPRKSNHLFADLAGAGYLRQVAAAGGRIRCYEPGMMHAKVALVDERIAVVGSANMDMRSLFLDYEIALFLYSPVEIARVSAWFESLSADCGDLQQASKLRAAAEDLGRLLAPLE